MSGGWSIEDYVPSKDCTPRLLAPVASWVAVFKQQVMHHARHLYALLAGYPLPSWFRQVPIPQS